VGHPEHDLLFVATQVARTAGLKNPSSSVGNFKIHKDCERPTSIGQAVPDSYIANVGVPKDHQGRYIPTSSTLFTESDTYRLLLRGKAPASEPFRKWVTEEVLPTIRKTGSYNAEDSTDPIAVGLMDDLRTLVHESCTNVPLFKRAPT
jgi:prophage antirepressor-like protein